MKTIYVTYDTRFAKLSRESVIANGWGTERAETEQRSANGKLVVGVQQFALTANEAQVWAMNKAKADVNVWSGFGRK